MLLTAKKIKQLQKLYNNNNNNNNRLFFQLGYISSLKFVFNLIRFHLQLLFGKKR